MLRRASTARVRAVARLVVLVVVGGGHAQATEASRVCGRVLERGSEVTIPGASVSTASGEPVITDESGRFCVEVEPGGVEVAVTASGYDPLHVREALPPNTSRTVEYRLMPAANAPKYRSVVRGAGVHEGEHFTLRDEELHTAPGTGGDPMRIVGSLPGVVAPIPILPLYVVRGGSPGMNGFFLDGMRVPELFHLVIVDGVVHPSIIDRLDFYPGGFDVTFGRVGSGVIDVATRPGRTDAPAHGEFELRLYDTSALIETRAPGGVAILVAGRYGYPGPIINLVEPGVKLTYWDYQLRIDWKGLTVEALGSYDDLTLGPKLLGGLGASGSFLVEFHRIQVREQWRHGHLELDGAIVGGLDRMALFSGEGVQELSLTARVSARYKLKVLTFSAGGDVELERYNGQNFGTDMTQDAPDELGDLSGNRVGVVGGAYAQAELFLDRWLHRPASITAGVRVDAYHADSVTLLGVDPRVLLRYRPIKALEMFGAFGQYSQAPSFPIPLPGIDTYELQLGLQRAVQGSFGFRLYLPSDVNASVTGYYGSFHNINDSAIDFESYICTSPPPESLKGIPALSTRQVDGDGYGMEVLVRRQKGRVSGWLSYTLSRAERIYSCGLRPADFNQAHVLNAVVQIRLPWRLLLGFRVNVQTGRPYTQLSAQDVSAVQAGNNVGVRNNARMPTYVQVDLRINREWIFKKWALAAFLEVLNLTYSESILGVNYPKDPTTMLTLYNQPEFQGFHWILPSLGLRARF